MKNNFWQKLNKPIYALAPMAGITDSAFRQICKQFGADVVYSEMASINALAYNPEKTLEMLKFNSIERPYVVQLFGNNPEYFAQATKIIEKEIKPDGIDINFGCPVPKIAKQKAGAELMKDLSLAKKVIQAVINNTNLPVSIKTRIQAGQVDILQFLEYINDLDIKALMIHGRTLKQGFSGPINFEIIKKAKKYFSGIILANGGINDLISAQEILSKTQVDGLGLARGILGNPWLFEFLKKQKERNISLIETKKIILQHVDLMIKLKPKKAIIEMRKHLCWCIKNFPQAKRLREKLVKVETLDDIIKLI